MEFYLNLAINPKPKARHRTGIRNHRIIHYSDQRTVAFEKQVRLLARTQFHHAPIKGPIRAVFLFKIEKPQKGRKGSKMKEPICTPDLDNLLKSVCDALNKICWNDDAQIVEICCKKIWAMEKETPSIQIWLDSLEAQNDE